MVNALKSRVPRKDESRPVVVAVSAIRDAGHLRAAAASWAGWGRPKTMASPGTFSLDVPVGLGSGRQPGLEI